MTISGDTAQVHPTLVARVDAAYAEAGLHGNCTSGGRTRAEQQALIDGYANRLAWRGGGHRDDPSNPFLHFNPANPVGTSRHELQRDGWAYAMDMAPAPGSTPALQRVLAKHGLRLPYSAEPWHVEPVEAGLLPAAPHTTNEGEDDVPRKVSSFALNINKPQDYASPPWRTIRGLLAAWGEPVTPDDSNGDRTKAAVHSHARKWAAAVGADDGIVGPRFWGHLVSALDA